MFQEPLLEAPESFTNAMKQKALRREIAQRQKVYAKLIAGGRMTKRQSDYEIGVMCAILADYVKVEGAPDDANRQS